MVFTETLKALRDAKNLTQDQLAEKLGISRSAISMYERGEREPDFETLEVIADFFNVDMNKLIGKNSNVELLMPNPYIEKYYQLNDANQQTVNNLIDDLSEKQKAQKAQEDKFEAALRELEEKAQRQALLVAYGGKNKIHEFTDEELAKLDEWIEEQRSKKLPK